MGYIAYIATALAVILLAVAVGWQTIHLIDWCNTLYAAYGDGTLVSYLRWHAYTYVSYIFGDNCFGWTVPEAV